MPKADEWAAHIARIEESGQGVAEYCAEQGLKAKTLHWWRSELRSRAREGRSGHRSAQERRSSGQRKAKTSPVKLAKVIPRSGGTARVPPQVTTGLRIALFGAEVVVEPGCNRQLLEMALSVLREGAR